MQDRALTGESGNRTDVLHRAASSADRIRIRSGGTCHRRAELEEHLAEENDAQAVADILTRLQFDDSRSGFECSCCGDPTIEFYSAGGLVAALGVHHGLSVRWNEGLWKGDSLLTSESAEFFFRWLADRGVPEPEQERQDELAARSALVSRSRSYEQLIPEPLLSKLKQATDADACAKAFATHLPDEPGRSRLCLRLYGSDEASWNVTAGLDEILAEHVLPGLHPRDLLEAAAVAGDDATTNGAARWLFGLKNWKDCDRAILRASLPLLGQWGLTHPRPVNRRRTFEALVGIGGDGAVSLLRAVLDGQIVARSAGPSQEADPSGMVTFMPGDDSFPTEFDDVICAGLALARLHDTSSLPRINALAERSPQKERAALELAIHGPPPGEEPKIGVRVRPFLRRLREFWRGDENPNR